MSDFTIDLLIKIPKMTPEDAERYLATLNLTEDERTTLQSKAGTKLVPGGERLLVRVPKPKPVKKEQAVVYKYDPQRPRWIAAAYLLGASLRQLAALHEVRHTTIYQSLNKTMPGLERKSKRIQPTLSLEALSTYHASYYEHLADLEDRSPHEVAQWLLDNTELDK